MPYRLSQIFAILAAFVLTTAPDSWGQALGTVSLNASLADAGVQVVGVFNKVPQSNQFLAYCEGPSMDAQGNLFFTEQNPNRIWKVNASGDGSIFGGTTNYGSNGTEFDPQGRLIVCQTSAIAAYDGNGNRTVIATVENLGDNNPSKPNDLTIGSNGAMYFSNWGSQVYHRSSAGQITKADTFQTSNGIEWVEERKKLYLSQDGPDKVSVYDVADDGKLVNGKNFASIPEPDGITVDEKGNIYVASYNDGKIYVFDTTGQSLGSVTVKSANTSDNNQNGNTSNCVIGADKKLYITGDGGLYSVQLKVGPRRRPIPVGMLQGAQHLNHSMIFVSSSEFNPVFQSLRISLPAAIKFSSVRIYDFRMREVWRDVPYGSKLEWNGRSSQGGLLPSGRYFLMAHGNKLHRPIATTVNLLRE